MTAMKILGYVAVAFGGAVATYLVFALQLASPGDFTTYLAFLSVMLTAVTVVLTAVAIGIGLVAAMTFKGLKEASEQTSKDVSAATAKAVADEALSEVRVRAIVLEIYATTEQERLRAAQVGDDPEDNEER
jgi:ABC-type siderophore export system fused ATPase/permease subunit